MKLKNRGFAALLLVISLSISIMVGLIEVGDSSWLLMRNINLLADRTQRQAAAGSCMQLALIYIAEDPEYNKAEHFDLGRGISCNINSILRSNADRVIETSGSYKNGTSTMFGVVGISNKGVIEKDRYFK